MGLLNASASVGGSGEQWWHSRAMVAASALAALLFALVLRPAPAKTFITSKALGSLMLVAERRGRQVSLEQLREGDHVQLQWLAPRAGYLAAIARPRSGEVELIFPFDQRAKKVPPLRMVTVGSSIQITRDMDGYRIWLLFDDQPFSLRPVFEAAEKSADAPAFPREIDQVEFRSLVVGAKRSSPSP